MKWFVTYDNAVTVGRVQFGPLATKEAAQAVREVIETVEGHEDLWLARDDDHPNVYVRELVEPRAKVAVYTPAAPETHGYVKD